MDRVAIQHVTDSLRSCLAALATLGISADEIGIETLERRFRAAVTEARAHVKVAANFLARSQR